MRETLLALLRVCFALMLLASVACSDPWCGDLVYDRANDTCVCPMGSWPNYELDRCEFPNGDVIPWMEFDVPVGGLMADSGMADSGMADAGPVDSGLDAMSLDMGAEDGGISMDAGDDADPLDAGPPPPAMLARFPWNGYSTGSIHVPETAPIANHPLRPKFMWEESAGAEMYQIQLTRECSVEDFRECLFSSPELDTTTAEIIFHPEESLPVSGEQPVGSRYYWRVRACSASEVCSAWTEPRYLNVGRNDHDYNGDGYADVAIGASQQASPIDAEGAAFVFFGGLGGVQETPNVTYDNPLNQAFGYFGREMAAVGDLNADGFADLAVGGNGNTYVYLGGAGGPSASAMVIEDGANVGSVGDVNGDGFSDLAIGVDIFLGNVGGPAARPEVSLLDRLGDGLGVANRAGDVNGDGFADVVVGSHLADFPEREEGVAYVYLGGVVIDEAASFTIDNPRNQAHGHFGWSAGSDDFDADGFSDLIVGARNQDGSTRDTGAAYVFTGSAEGPAASASASLVNPTGDEFGGFGTGVAGIGDANGDGYMDAIVGASDRQHMRTGAAYVFLGSATGLTADPTEIRNPFPLPSAFASQFFGEFVVGVGDINGEGYADVVISAKNQDSPETREGSAYVFFGQSTGISTVPGDELDNPADQPGGRFGFGVAR